MELRSGTLMLGFATGASVGVSRGYESRLYSPFGVLGGAPWWGGTRDPPERWLNLNIR
jgi:hypothetical protein